MSTFEHIQDVIGQLPVLKSYTHVLLCFPLSEEKRQTTVQDIESAVHHVVKTLPFLSGIVVNEGSGSGNSGVFKVARCEERESPEHAFVRVVDCTAICSSYDEICAAHGPASLLPGRVLAPRKAFPDIYQESAEDPAPVLDVQANFVRGGLLLDVAGQHNIIDATGLFQVVNLLAIALRNEPIPKLYISEGNRDRRSLIPLLGPDEPLLDHSDLQTPVLPATPPASFLATYKWRSYQFPSATVTKVKEMANQHPEDFDPSTPTISLNDAITAFCWQRLTAVRLQTLQTPNATSKLSRAVDFRRVMNLTPAYLGHMVRIAGLSLSFEEIASSSLSRLASMVRKAVQDISTQYALRSYVTFIANEPDKSTILYNGSFDPMTDFVCSSITHVKIPVFGDLGRPGLVRRPDFGPLPCSSYMAETIDGEGLEAMICLRDEEAKALADDTLWRELVKTVE
ncbi:hypothetical protein BDV25DRAFT_136940 [Aspergillus avenaceus]|uniref:Trichothecene 3-O-acetyltransferase-like N-terminal domain-containing protein n=1 Tax=Aspergillus avenaceus TaxID=36643 RepID=A0A5N6U434_ASPAV|nr:hypothetical protein BDV25DRAFT_136940 [Aspergillus avenaceus]